MSIVSRSNIKAGDRLLAPTATKGAYCLAIDLATPLALATPIFKGQELGPGRYLYCGSAYGHGGLAARLRRHLRPGKTPHWHVDHLTLAGQILAIAAIPGGNECRLCESLRQRPDVQVPLPRFGSSDCHRCPAHLLQVPLDLDLARLKLPWLDLQAADQQQKQPLEWDSDRRSDRPPIIVL